MGHSAPAQEPAKDAAGFQTVSASHQRARAKERDAEAAKTAAGPPGLTSDETQRAAMTNKFDLLELEEA